ncbi:MAG: hypothetical protein COZ65_02310 [Caldiserica bacterium CG_4_8_14_3_um_filter_35_18]|nr:MAG: hypothetical protein COZ65_02310 [Caldiserica bacterium CG_4_8_14_3_um_filter_35_18]
MIKKRGEKSPLFFCSFSEFPFARSVSLHLTQALLCFTSLAEQKTNTPPTLFPIVAGQSQAWSSVSKPNTRNATLGLNIGTQ